MQRILYIVLFLCLGLSALWADDRKQPSLLIEDNTFFDPTKPKHEDQYRFAMEYRLEAGYVQHWQKTKEITFPDMYLHGLRLGATFSFVLPAHFNLQTGLLYTLVYGQNEQHWRSMDAPNVQTEYIRHRVLEHSFCIPVRAYYIIPIWKQLNLFFYSGPQLHIGLAQNDYMKLNLSDGTKNWLESQSIPTQPYDRMADELIRANIQWGVGGGLEWDMYRLQSGYEFGLNNLIKHPKTSAQYMAEWGWMVTFSYRF